MWRNNMAAYLPPIIWIVSSIICLYIARAKNLKSSFVRRLIVVLLGPLAIPLVFLAKTGKSTEND